MSPEQFEILNQKIDANNQKTDVIYRRLVGEPKLKVPGLLEEVEKNTQHRQRSNWFMGLMAGIGTALGWFWHKIIEALG